MIEKLTKEMTDKLNAWIRSCRLAQKHNDTSGQQGADLAADFMVTLGATYDEAIRTLKSQLVEKGETPEHVNRSRDLVAFALATHGDAERDWPAVRFAKAVLKRAKLSAGKACEADAPCWFELVAAAEADAKLELQRAAAERGDDDYEPDAAAIAKRVRSVPREETTTAATAATERTPSEHVEGVIQLHFAKLSESDKLSHAAKLLGLPVQRLRELLADA